MLASVVRVQRKERPRPASHQPTLPPSLPPPTKAVGCDCSTKMAAVAKHHSTLRSDVEALVLELQGLKQRLQVRAHVHACPLNILVHACSCPAGASAPLWAQCLCAPRKPDRVACPRGSLTTSLSPRAHARRPTAHGPACFDPTHLGAAQGNNDTQADNDDQA